MLDILYRDEQLVAINKPSGLLVHRSDIDRHETRFAVQLLRDQIGLRVHPLHRLDKGTSGVLLFALDSQSAREISLQFERHQVDKHYVAVVRGWPDECGSIDHPLSRQTDNYRRLLTVEQQQALPALTHYRRLASADFPVAVDRYPSARYALVALQPVTGRQHQLRRHMKHIAHPIIGDATWGKGKHNRFFQQHFGVDRLLLACTQITIHHPRIGQMLTIAAPPTDTFATFAGQMGWKKLLVPSSETSMEKSAGYPDEPKDS